MTAPTPVNAGPISAADHLATFISDRFLVDGTDRPTIYKILDALLAGGTLREEWGVRITWPVGDDVWPDGHTEDMWGDRGDRGLAERRYEIHNSPRTRTSAQLIRQFVIVTAPEVTQ